MKRIAQIIVGLFVIALFFIASLLLETYHVIHIPLYLYADEDQVESDDYLSLRGELAGQYINEYTGRYEKEVNLYREFLAAIDNNDRELASTMLKEGSHEQLDWYIELIKQGRELWEYTKIHSAYEYGNKVVFFVTYKIKGKDFYPFRFVDISRDGEKIFIDLNKNLDFLKTELRSVGFHMRSATGVRLSNLLERALSRGMGVFNRSSFEVVEGVSFSYIDGSVESDDKNVEVIFSYLNDSNRESTAPLQDILSSESNKNLQRWMSKSIKSGNSIDELIPMIIPKNLEYIGDVRVNSSCYVVYFARSGDISKTRPFLLCNYGDGYKIFSLMMRKGYKIFSKTEFITNLFQHK